MIPAAMIGGDNRQRHQIHRQQSQILAQYHLGGGHRQGVEQLIGFLAALLGDDPHGEQRHNDDKNNAAEAEHIFKVAHSRHKVIVY